MKNQLPISLSAFLDGIGMRSERPSSKTNSAYHCSDKICYRDDDGLLHKEDGPALIFPDGSTEWWRHGKKHRENGPAVESANGTKEWYVNHQNHRTDGPAVIKSCGDILYYYEGKLHRTDGPAVHLVDGTKKWYRMGKLHREDGPAIEKKSSINGNIVRRWYWEGEEVSEAEVLWRVKEKQLNASPPVIGSQLKNLFSISGVPHNPYGPARIWFDGTQEWFLNGRRHRTDGPAVVLPNGEEYYYLFGDFYSKSEYMLRTKSKETKAVEHINILPNNSNSSSKEEISVVPMPASDACTAMVVASKEESAQQDNVATENVEKDKNKVKQWPDEPDELVLYKDIYEPLKAILEKGYRLIRNSNEWKFDYNGYEIGKIEKKIFPNAKEHFTEKFLRREKEKNDQSLMDIVMRLMFLMGIEQGRRMAYNEQMPVRTLEKTLASYRERNKSIRYQLAKANAALKIREENPTLPTEEVNNLIKVELEKTRLARIEEIKKEIKTDPSLSCFKTKVKKKAKLTDLLALANTLDEDVFKQEDWQLLLKEANCSIAEWKLFCKKHKYNKFVR